MLKKVLLYLSKLWKFHLKHFCLVLWRHTLILVNTCFENVLLVQTAKNRPEPHYLLQLTET